MKRLRVALFACFVCLCLGRVGSAQDVVGSTAVDIDPDSGTVTATCETDVDGGVEAYYRSEVSCIVRDQDGNFVTSGTDTGSTTQGPALVVLTFVGVPGTTYIATGGHEVMAVVVDRIDFPHMPTPAEYYDEFNFESFTEDPQTFPDDFDWEGPGPENITQIRTFRVGNTTASQIRYYTPSELLTLILSAQSLFPSHCDTVFSNVVPSYNNNGFFASLEGTTFIQYPLGAANIPAHGSADAATLINQSGRPIELFPNFYPTAAGFPAGFQEFILIHEGLHHYTGWTDFPTSGALDFETQFFSSGYRNTTGTTNDFTVWLTSGCPPAS